MKSKPNPQEKPTVDVTTKVRLTFRGQIFDMTMDELEKLHDCISKVVEASKPKVIHVPVPREPRERLPYFWNPQKLEVQDPKWDAPSITCLPNQTTFKRITDGTLSQAVSRDYTGTYVAPQNP